MAQAQQHATQRHLRHNVFTDGKEPNRERECHRTCHSPVTLGSLTGKSRVEFTALPPLIASAAAYRQLEGTRALQFTTLLCSGVVVVVAGREWGVPRKRGEEKEQLEGMNKLMSPAAGFVRLKCLIRPSP